ncbi:serine/threonine-protein kinase [Paludibaculum fermentans]|uniref:non-specific serine/threonine protein kinase n=1 Tax=Paludibaculum fermentans TaxID=1473598 RepID=A0A7S7SK62_PALFE|nr:serine/threonine-protein kinase [Paludibaculum fermentans]QOY88807.1 protein kinase [Paludibaculum fermentans]
MDYAIGSRIGDYEIISVLGAGGMGKVYKVRNLLTERTEALKVLLMNAGEERDQADRFLREIKVQARLTHRNIAGLHTALRVDNQVLMVMEYVEGTTLERLLKLGPAPPRKAAELMSQVLSALAYAHGEGVVHRDLKPANIMVTTEGVIKLLDFGIAKLKQDQSLTKTGFTVGSLPYMSPEQIEGATDLDHRADIYALGISLYEIVTGRRPFLGDSDYSLMVAHLKQTPVPPIEIDPNVPQALNDIILTAIEKDRERRFQSAAAMLRAMETLLGGPAAGATVTRPAVAASVSPATHTPAAATGVVPPAATTGGAAPLSASAFMQSPVSAPAPEFPAPAYAPAADVPTGRPLGNRGLYIAIGSLATVAVLIVGAVQIPKLFRTQAGGPTQSLSSGQDATGTPQPPRVEPSSGPATGPASSPVAGQAPVSQPVSGGAKEVPVPTGGGRPHADPVSTRPGSSQASIEPSGASQNPVVTAPPVVQQPAGSNAASQAAEASAGALRDLREQLMLLGTRATTVKASLERMKQAQARQGLGMRGDINTAAQRMEFYLDECEGAMKRGDLAGGKKYLDLGEREVSKLESFLGR